MDVTASNKQEKDGEEICPICQLKLSERGEHIVSPNIVSPILMKDDGNGIKGGDKCQHKFHEKCFHSLIFRDNWVSKVIMFVR